MQIESNKKSNKIDTRCYIIGLKDGNPNITLQEIENKLRENEDF